MKDINSKSSTNDLNFDNMVTGSKAGAICGATVGGQVGGLVGVIALMITTVLKITI